jgi:hypothetical protein
MFTCAKILILITNTYYVGALVKKMLETKKELESTSKSKTESAVSFMVMY